MTVDRKDANTSGAPPQREAPKKYRDRPADEGKHGDAGDEPNSGVPALPKGPTGKSKP